MRWRSAISAAWSTSPCTIAARALRRQRGEPGVLGRDDRPAGSSASAPPPQPCPRSTATVGTVSVVRVAMQRAISPAIARSSASGDSSAPGVSMTVTSGSPSSSASRIPRRASRSAAGPMACAGDCRAVLADHDARLPVEPGQRDQHRAVALALVGAAQPHGRVAAVAQQLAYAGAVPARGSAATDSQAALRSTVGALRRAGSGRGRRRVDQHAPAPGRPRRQVLGGDDGVDDAALGEVLRGLHPRRERLARRAPRTPWARGTRSALRAPRPSRGRASPTRRSTPPVVGWRR